MFMRMGDAIDMALPDGAWGKRGGRRGLRPKLGDWEFFRHLPRRNGPPRRRVRFSSFVIFGLLKNSRFQLRGSDAGFRFTICPIAAILQQHMDAV